MAVGLDIGSCFIVSAREKDGNISYTRQRDGFFTIEAETSLNAKFIEQGLKKSNVAFLKKDNSFYILGEPALEKAVERRAVLQRPMQNGIINSREPAALEMIKNIIGGVLGTPVSEKETCVYSIPESPIDATFDIVYHKNILNQILKDLGYSGTSLNEAEAIAYSELMDEGLTGVAISCGAGMTNFVVMSNGRAELKFSISKGGDFIDERVATSLGLPQSLVQVEKESGLNLDEPNGKIQSAISIYYDHLISIIVRGFIGRLSQYGSCLPKFSSPVSIVVSGGTAIPIGFIDRFEREMRKSVTPFSIGAIRKASLSLESVARGCWLASSIM